MKFPFIKIPSFSTQKQLKDRDRIAPIISVGLFNKSDLDKFVYIKAMIDSGAGFSIFPSEIGKIIGLEIEKGILVPIQGIHKDTCDTYLHDIVLEVGGWKFATHACFSTKELFSPVLGRDGFFSLFKVTMSYSKAQIELKPIAEPLKINFH